MTLLLPGCVSYNEPEKTSYFGGEITITKVAKTHYGVSTRQIEQSSFETYVVIPGSFSKDELYREILSDKAGELCDDAFDLKVERSEIHGSIGADLPNDWLTVSQKAILKCARLRH